MVGAVGIIWQLKRREWNCYSEFFFLLFILAKDIYCATERTDKKIRNLINLWRVGVFTHECLINLFKHIQKVKIMRNVGNLFTI